MFKKIGKYGMRNDATKVLQIVYKQVYLRKP